MIKKLFKPFRWLLGLDLLNDEIGKKLKEIENLHCELDDALNGNVSLSCALKHKDEEIKILEAKITMQSESLRKAAERIVELEKEKQQLEILKNVGDVVIHHLESFVKTKPYKVWVTRDNKKHIRHPDVEIWLKKPKLSLDGMYDGDWIVAFPENTFRRHCGFVPYKGQMLEGSMCLEVKR